MRLIDTHTHIYGSEFDEDRAEVFVRAEEAGVEAFVFPAIDHETNDRQFALTRSRHDCYSLVGLHPTSVNDNPHWREELAVVERLLRACNGGASEAPVGSSERPVERFYGVGEVGLDFYWSRDWMAEQRECFVRQVELSVEYDLPLVIHTRDAWDDMLSILDLDRKENCYIANIVKCRPPRNRDPLETEQDACIGYLRNQVALVKPKIIVCLGRIAAKRLIDPDFRITRQHGTWVERNGVWMSAIYHPSALLRDVSKRPETFDDLMSLREKIKEVGAKI